MMESNYVPGQRCFWLHKATMALFFIVGPKFTRSNWTPLYFTKPKNPEDFFRVYIETVRTKKDIARMKARFAKAKKKFAAQLAKKGGAA